MNNLATRVVTAIFFILLIVVGVCYSSNSLFLLFLLVNFLGLWEYQSLVTRFAMGNRYAKTLEQKWGIALFGSIIYVITVQVTLGNWPVKYVFLLALVPAILFIKELFTKAENPFGSVALELTGFLYITTPCILLNLIAHQNGQFTPLCVLGIFFLVGVSDTGAYFVGSKFGNTPLFERISPKKTWEGWLGGAVCAFIVAYLLGLLFTDFSIKTWNVIAFIAVVFGTLGDLVESLLKRSLKVKDSGSILPGHGGILDRFDAFLFTIPLIYVYLNW